MPLNPLEMSGGGVPGIGEPSCLTFGVPALASALACVSCLQVWPGGGCSAAGRCCSYEGSGYSYNRRDVCQ